MININFTKLKQRIKIFKSRLSLAMKILKGDDVTNEINEIEYDEELFSKLRKLRLNLSRTQKIKAYYIFDNITLWEMTKKKPKNKEEMLDVYGVGPYKVEKYGDAFLHIINTHMKR